MPPATEPSELTHQSWWHTIWRYRTPRQSFRAERLDAPNVPKAVLAGTFKDLRRINRWFGGWSLVDGSLRPFLPSGGEVRLLDLAAGAADVPLALARRWRKRGIRLHILAVDLNPTIVELACDAARREGQTDFEAVAADVFQYPWPDQLAYDFVTCSLAFHHFEATQCVKMLELMARLSERAFVVNDLRRSWWGFVGAKFLTWTITRDPFNRHDAPLSILRSFTQAQMQTLVDQAVFPAGMRVEVRRKPFSRLAVVGNREL